MYPGASGVLCKNKVISTSQGLLKGDGPRGWVSFQPALALELCLLVSLLSPLCGHSRNKLSWEQEEQCPLPTLSLMSPVFCDTKLA